MIAISAPVVYDLNQTCLHIYDHSNLHCIISIDTNYESYSWQNGSQIGNTNTRHDLKDMYTSTQHEQKLCLSYNASARSCIDAQQQYTCSKSSNASLRVHTCIFPIIVGTGLAPAAARLCRYCWNGSRSRSCSAASLTDR